MDPWQTQQPVAAVAEVVVAAVVAAEVVVVESVAP